MMYMPTLYGHDNNISQIISLHKTHEKLFSQMFTKIHFVKFSSCVCKSRYGVFQIVTHNQKYSKQVLLLIIFKFYWVCKWHDAIHNK